MTRPSGEPLGFETTQWSLVLTAGEQVGFSEHDSLCELCQRYWRPLYGFARRQGHSIHEAETLLKALSS
ncbi:hypothetical protein [Novipirellula artificiosorum]|uniref:hypothetical protein n=1 Tax=Novipirellula artificiosorum TaxID=2528016 RepID=UPI0011B3F204|nr:hypothetical protein [Novipirellula artificiosorum]